MMRIVPRWWVALVNADVRYERRGRKQAVCSFRREQRARLELMGHFDLAVAARDAATLERDIARGRVLDLESENRRLREQFAGHLVPAGGRDG